VNEPRNTDPMCQRAVNYTCARAELRVSVTNHSSPVTTFLIDTPAIRNTPKSCDCIVSLNSNRHASGACKLH
jgi:hypothetical protein